MTEKEYFLTFDIGIRGGLVVNRDALHASKGYKRQVEALRKLTNMMEHNEKEKEESSMTELRSEVREALGVMRGLVECVCLDDYKKRGLVDPTCDHECAEYVDEIESELHRLIDVLKRAEAERDALRARIDVSPSIEISREDWLDHATEISPSFIGMRVAIVPLED